MAPEAPIKWVSGSMKNTPIRANSTPNSRDAYSANEVTSGMRSALFSPSSRAVRVDAPTPKRPARAVMTPITGKPKMRAARSSTVPK